MSQSKLTNVDKRANEVDKEYFDSHPGQTEYTRPPLPGECSSMPYAVLVKVLFDEKIADDFVARIFYDLGGAGEIVVTCSKRWANDEVQQIINALQTQLDLKGRRN